MTENENRNEETLETTSPKEEQNINKTATIITFGLGVLLFVILIVTPIFISMRNEDVAKKYGYDIPSDNNFVLYEDMNILLSELQNEVGVQYFLLSRTSCPWCKEYVPYINQYAEEYDVEIKLLDPSPYKGYTLTEEGEFNFDHIEYQKMIDFISSSPYCEELKMLQKYTVCSPSGNVKKEVDWLYVPYLYKVENGVVVEVLKTPEDHVKDENGVLPLMNKKQEALFRYYLVDFFE